MTGDSFEIYIHIPFCVQKCLYCDFLSGPAEEPRRRAYTQALLGEMRTVQEGKGRQISSVFVGGGTPSLLSLEDLAAVFKELHRSFMLKPDAEITVEANPGTLDREKLSLLRSLGVNRLSLGLQSVHQDELRLLGRIHSYETFLSTYQAAREAGFDNLNVDLMMALPGSTRRHWEETLRRVADLSPEHISAYSLIIEAGTPFARLDFEGLGLSLPGEEEEYEMYEDTARILGGYGYHQYEISNYAREGRQSRHNLGYWEGREYLGLGLGAASLWGNVRFSNTRDMELYLAHSGQTDRIREPGEVLSREDQMAERLILGLRKTRGISEATFLEEFGISLEEKYGDVIRKYEDCGLLQRQEGRLSLTRRGIHVSNRIMADFLPE